MEDVLHHPVAVVVILKLVVRREDSSEPFLTEGRVVVGGDDAVAKSLPAARDLKMPTLLPRRVIDLAVLVRSEEVEHLESLSGLCIKTRGELRPLLLRVAARVEDREELSKRRHSVRVMREADRECVGVCERGGSAYSRAAESLQFFQRRRATEEALRSV